jgi:hypothetical protein
VKTIRIDGVDYEVGSDAFAQALAKHQEKTDEAMAAAQAMLDRKDEAIEKLQAKLDEALETVKKKDAEIAELPKKLIAETKARAELEQKARTVLGAKAKLDADDTKLRIQVISALTEGFSSAGKSPAYIEARFDAALEQFDARADEDEDVVAKARQDVENVDDNEDEAPLDSSEAYLKMRKDNASAWKHTLKRGGIEV